MAREVRISIDDDEVFERMKARKRELDCSWEEVLHRGLREFPEGEPAAEEPHTARGRRGYDEYGRDDPGFGDPGFEPPGVGAADRRRGRGRGGREPPVEGIGDVVDQFQSQLREQIQGQLQESLESSIGSMGGIEREVDELQAAEDAVLRFDFLDDDGPTNQVPLRVTLQTGTDGLDVDVVAVRRGKSAQEMNRFSRDERQRINVELARGASAVLAFDGDESYDVAPVLSWTRDGDGRPIVDDVAIDRVIFDDEA